MKVGPASFAAPLAVPPTSALPPQEEEKSFMEMSFKNMAVSSEKPHTTKPEASESSVGNESAE